MILGLLLKGDEFLLTIRSSDDSCEFRRSNLNWVDSRETSGRGYIWDLVSDDLKNAYAEADTLAVTLPASACMVKRIVIEKRLEDGIPEYREWRAGIELPGGSERFGYGFLPSMKDPGGVRSETVFFAVPIGYLQRLTRAVIGENDSREICIMPEQAGLAELASRSARDYSQVALAHFDRQYAVVIVIRDGRFYGGRYFRSSEQDLDEISVDIETFMLSVAPSDESCPLIVTGLADSFKTSWSPILPAFLEEPYLEFSSVWGITEFISKGGRCELQGAR